MEAKILNTNGCENYVETLNNFNQQIIIKQEETQTEDVGNFKTFQGVSLKLQSTKVEHSDSEDQFNCDLCNFKALNADDLKQHIRKHTKVELNVCGLNSEEKKEFKMRLKTHSEDMHYKCDACNFRCELFSELEQHSLIHYEEFNCDICDYKCRHENDLKEHIKTHAENSLEYELSYNVHGSDIEIGLINSAEIIQECDVSDGTTTITYHYNHYTEDHLHCCSLCDFKSIHENDLQKHFSTRHTATPSATTTHTRDKPFACNMCDYRCERAAHLKRHIYTHTGVKPFECDVCEYKCVQVSHLMRHMRTHTGEKPYACDECDYTTSYTNGLKIHKRRHTGEKPYACDLCDYKCIQACDLQIHKRKHSGDKPYQCAACDYRCIDASQLRKHTRKHTGDKPHKCDKCDYRTTNISNLKRHVIGVHQKDKTIYQRKSSQPTVKEIIESKKNSSK